MSVVEGFEVLTRGYLGQDWNLDAETADDALTTYAQESSTPDLLTSVAGFEQLLATVMTEQEYYEQWIYGLHSGYDPRQDGFTFREWFAHALAVLRAEAAKQSE